MLYNLAYNSLLKLVEAVIWLWSFSSQIYIYLYKQYLSPLKLWVWILFMLGHFWYNFFW